MRNEERFNEFKKVVTENIKKYLPESYQDADVIINKTTNSVETYDGMIVKRPSDIVVPTINLNGFFEEYSGDMTALLKEIAEKITMKVPDEIKKLQEYVEDYEKVKDNLFIKLGFSENEKREDIVHRDIGDITITYYIAIGSSSLAITDSILDTYDITEEQLYNDAVKNTAEKIPYTAQNLGMIFGMDDGPNITVLSNEEGYLGAATMLYPDVLENISGGKRVYILPSSIHEILINHNSNADTEHLLEVVQSANKAVVEPEEKLSDHVFVYENGKISVAA